MSFSFVWIKKRNYRLSNTEFFEFLRHKRRASFIRKRYRQSYIRVYKRGRWGRSKYKRLREFNLIRLRSFYRIRFGLTIQNFRDIFCWIRFLSNVPKKRFVVYRSAKNSNRENLQKYHSLLFVPLTKYNLSIPRSYGTLSIRKNRRIPNLILNNRRLYYRSFMYRRSILLFLSFIYLSQLYRLSEAVWCNNDYVKFLNIINKFRIL